MELYMKLGTAWNFMELHEIAYKCKKLELHESSWNRLDCMELFEAWSCVELLVTVLICLEL